MTAPQTAMKAVAFVIGEVQFCPLLAAIISLYDGFLRQMSSSAPREPTRPLECFMAFRSRGVVLNKLSHIAARR